MIGKPYDDFAEFVNLTLSGTAINNQMYTKTISINRYFQEIVTRLYSEGYIKDERLLYNLQFKIEYDKEHPNAICINPANEHTREMLELLVELQNSDEAHIEQRSW